MEGLADVLVVGGGPAGSTVSTLLARKGHKVTLFERERFPRDHVGESLLPYCYRILEELGVVNEMKEKMVRKPGVRFIDADGVQHTTWCFSAVIDDETRLSFQVRRDRFDHMLLRNAEANGVQVHEETRVREVDLDHPDGIVTVTATGPDGVAQEHKGRFIVDASGRDTFMANRFGTKTKNEALDRTALSLHWMDVPLTGGLEEGLIQIVYLGGEQKGWTWMIPVSANRVSIGTVLSSNYYREQRQKLLDAGSLDWKKDLYLQELRSSPFVAEAIAGATQVSQMLVNGDYSYKSDKKYGERFALIGDAHTFLDPIFSSGVYLSMNTARLVAEALDTWLSGDIDSPETELKAVYDHIVGAYHLVEKAIMLFYNPTAINFAQAASAAELIHERHKNALAGIHYVLAGDFFDRHEDYSKVLDLLADPDLFAKYRALILDRPGYDTSTCNMTREEAFSEFLRNEVEPAPAVY
jgi:flavin-dependent dehydrogenase